MKFCRQTSSDIKKYFQGSYIKFPEAGEVLHYIDRVDTDSIRGKLWAPDEKGVYSSEPFVYWLNNEDGSTPEVEYILPRKSYFNYDGRAFLLLRVPARQYHRGLTGENTSVVAVGADGNFTPYSLNFEVLTAYVGKQSFLHFAQRSVSSYAVSRRIAVSASGQVFIDKVKVGTINYDDRTITVVSDLFIPELQRVVKEHGQDFKVDVKKAVRKARATTSKIKENEIEF